MRWNSNMERRLALAVKQPRRNVNASDERMSGQVQAALAGLDDRSRTALNALFGLKSDTPLWPGEVADALNITKSDLREIYADALRTLRSPEAERYYDC